MKKQKRIGITGAKLRRAIKENTGRFKHLLIELATLEMIKEKKPDELPEHLQQNLCDLLEAAFDELHLILKQRISKIRQTIKEQVQEWPTSVLVKYEKQKKEPIQHVTVSLIRERCFGKRSEHHKGGIKNGSRDKL
jgi:hypothetical protein